MGLNDVTAKLQAAPSEGIYEAAWQGLRIGYMRIGERRRVTLGREDRPPSPDEALRVARAFHAPVDAEPRRAIRKVKHPETGRTIRYHVVEYTWIELGCQGATVATQHNTEHEG